MSTQKETIIQDPIVVPLRPKTGKGANKQLRRQGMLPATIYGLAEPPVSVSILAKTVARVLSTDTGMNSMICLQHEGTDVKGHVIIKELMRDPITGRLAHVDFMRVDPKHKVRVKVPIILKGTPVGVKEGGLLDFIHREIEVECLPSFIPPHIDINVDHMKVGDTFRLDQVQLDAHLTVLGDPHNVLCSVHGLKAEEVEEKPVEAAVAPVAPEPEVVSKKSKREDK